MRLGHFETGGEAHGGHTLEKSVVATISVTMEFEEETDMCAALVVAHAWE